MKELHLQRFHPAFCLLYQVLLFNIARQQPPPGIALKFRPAHGKVSGARRKTITKSFSCKNKSFILTTKSFIYTAKTFSYRIAPAALNFVSARH